MAQCEHVVLMGDCNARTNNVCDYMIFDKSITNEFELDISDIGEGPGPKTVIDDLYLPHLRRTHDIGKVNNFDTNLLEMCRNSPFTMPP